MKGKVVQWLKNGLSLLMGVYVALLSIIWFKHLSNLYREKIGGGCQKSSLPTQLPNMLFPEAYFQIAYADIIILNKVDLVSAEGSGALEELEEEIHNINSLAEIVHSVRCQVDISRILNRQAYDTAVLYTYFCSSFIAFPSHLQSYDVSFQHATHLETLLEESRSLSTKKLHDSGMRTICICEAQTVDLDKIRIWLEEILWEKKYDMDVYRCK